MSHFVLANALLPDGRQVDVEVSEGYVSRVVPAGDNSSGGGKATAGESTATPDPIRYDLEGDLLLCAPAEPHAHIDKALTADLIPNETGDLEGAIAGWRKFHAENPAGGGADFDGTVERASQAVELAISHGITAIRSHANVGEYSDGIVAVKALAEVKKRYAEEIDLQIVPLLAPTVVGAEGAYGREQLRLAIEHGADIVGGCPMLEEKPAEAISIFLDAAEEASLPVDLHTDEALDPALLTVLEIARQIRDRGFDRSVAASHCVSLGVLEPETQRKVVAEIADAGIRVVTLPQTNLFLQAREMRTSPPRGLTALDALAEADVICGAGGDNLQDPFNLVGRGDPMETASLLVAAGHQSPERSYELVASSSRVLMDLPQAGPAEGLKADLLAVNAPTLRAAVAGTATRKRTFRGGRLISEMTTEVNRF